MEAEDAPSPAAATAAAAAAAEPPLKKRRKVGRRLDEEDRKRLSERYLAWVESGRIGRSPAPELMAEFGVDKSYFSRVLKKAGVKSTHLSMEAKVDINRRYLSWVEGGRKRKESPIRELMEKYGVAKTYFSKLLRKVKDTGSVAKSKKKGVPVIDWGFWGPEVVEVINAQGQKHLSTGLIHRELRAKFTGEELESRFTGRRVPSQESIRKWMNSQGYKTAKRGRER